MNNKTAFEIYKKYLLGSYPNKENKLVSPTKEKTAYAILNSQSEKFNENFVLKEETIKNNLWFWSDLHFFHKNIIKYSDRPFINEDEMHNAMIKNYHKLISKDDTVIFVGDITFGNISTVNSWIESFPGKKILVLGNHDIVKDKVVNLTAFDEICATFHFNYLNIDYIVSHYPIHESLLETNIVNIHGHTHTIILDEKYINVCVENTEYKPKKFEI